MHEINFSEGCTLPGGRGSGPDEAHPYERKMLGCPCPAISTMINHSYLKVEDSKHRIPISKVMVALVECYNFSWPFAIIITIVAAFRLGKIFGFSIQELGKHGKIEHDASMTRFDAKTGNALDPNPELIEKLFESFKSSIDPKNKGVTLEDFSKKRLELASKITRCDAQSPSGLKFLGRGEICLSLQAHFYRGSDSVSPVSASMPQGERLVGHADWLKIWFLEERLPVELGWKRPESQTTTFRTVGPIKDMKKIENGLL